MVLKMKFRDLLLLSLALVICSISCKKDDDEETKEYLSGSIKISLQAYVSPGYTKSFQVDTMSTLSRADGGSIGYYFRVSAFALLDTVKRENDRVARAFTLVVPDSLGTFSLQVAGFSTDYYSSSAEAPFTTVIPGHGKGSSITGFDIKDTDRLFTDPRDKRDYYVFTAGNTEWMRENLAWNGAGVPYNHCDVMSGIFGRFYTWEEAQNACPEGWRLPSENDWQNLALSMGVTGELYESIPGVAGKLMEDVKFNGSAMWPFERYVKKTNEARFSAMPVGYALTGDGIAKFKDIYSYAVFWSSDQDKDGGYCRYLYKEQDYLYSGVRDKSSFAASVRCVKDVK